MVFHMQGPTASLGQQQAMGRVLEVTPGTPIVTLRSSWWGGAHLPKDPGGNPGTVSSLPGSVPVGLWATDSPTLLLAQGTTLKVKVH